MMKISIAMVIALLSFNCFSFDLTTEQKLADFDQLVANMKNGYGPLNYKKTIGIDLNKLGAVYREKVRATKTNGEFYYAINKFIAEFHDGHFGAKIPTDHEAKVPFVVNWVNGKVLIDEINRDKLSKEDFPFERGDEVVEVDGQATQEFLTGGKVFRGSGFSQTELASAAYTMTRRRGMFRPVPSGKVKFKIRRGTSAVVESIELEWEHKGDAGDEHPDFDNKLVELGPTKIEKIRNLSIQHIYREFFGDDLDNQYHCNGGTRVAIPDDATIIMEKPFVAYYHKTEKGNVGYLRIPHYYPRDEQGKNEFELRFFQYEYAVSVLEQNTVGLVIDQDHNCGGSVSYLHKILSLFIDRPFAQMDFELLANKEEYLDFQKWLGETDKHTREYVESKKLADLIKSSWKKGKFLTEKTHIWGAKTIHPHHVNYTRPILVLIDYWAGSGGDAFPAMIHGLGRAKLFGTRTSGLGGHVEEQPALTNSRISYRMTKSLFYRPDGVAIENNGAVPDINYTITRDDFLYEFKDYQKTYLAELLKMIP